VKERPAAVLVGTAAGTLAPPATCALAGIGFLGAYTTFSTMAMDGVRLLERDRFGLAVGYWLATLLA
jgi:fluoride exporter